MPPRKVRRQSNFRTQSGTIATSASSAKPIHHQMKKIDSNCYVTDTVPDQQRFQTLYLTKKNTAADKGEKMPSFSKESETARVPDEKLLPPDSPAKPIDHEMKKIESETGTVPDQQIFEKLIYLTKKKTAADKGEEFEALNYLTKKETEKTAAEKDEKMPLFSEGSHIRFELCNVVPTYETDDMVKNVSGYHELLMFGIIQAETCFSDPSHYASFSTFNRNFDDPLIFKNSGSLPPLEISHCSLSVSTSVKITAKLYATTYEGRKVCGTSTIHDYFKFFPVPPHKIEHPTTLAEWEKAKKVVHILNDGLEISKGDACINLSVDFAGRPNGGSGSCKINGRNGCLELYYVALKNAVDSTLKVVFGATSEETKVAGKIRAYYGRNFDYGSSAAEKDLYCSTLFETKPGDFVKPGEVNLVRSLLAVPAQSSLLIDANLHDFTSGDVVLSGVYEFLVPAESGVKVAYIKGNDCSLKLIVDWKLPLDMLSV